MEWLIQALRVLREVRDWPDVRRNGSRPGAARPLAPPPASTPSEAATLVVPLGPAATPAAPPPPKKAPPAPPARPHQRRSRRGEEGQEPRLAERQEIPLEQIDAQAVAAVRRLRRYGFKAYLVGGCVRDLLLGFKPKDFDVATDARPEEVKSIFRNSRIIGRRFRLVHLYFQGGKLIEVSTFRANQTSEEEAEESQDLLIRRDNVFGSEEEDALRRDFTINALFYDVTTGKIIDHVGGLTDIRGRYLRMIGDPDVRLREDPVRILRAIRFTAKTDLRVDPELKSAMMRHKDEIRRCPPARVLEETLRLLRIGHAAKTVRLMDESGILKILLPEIHDFLDGKLETAEAYRPEDAAQALYAHLEALDALIARESVSDAVVLAALIYAPLSFVVGSGEESRDRSRRLADFIALITARMTLTRRLNEDLRQLFMTLRVMERSLSNKGGRGRRRRGGEGPRRGVLPEALQLFEIHLLATGQSLELLETWQNGDGVGRSAPREPDENAEEGAVAEDAPMAEAAPPNEGEAPAEGDDNVRRRRRRGGRGRRRAATSPA